MADSIPGDPARPQSVSDLRKRFEGKGKAQSPAEFQVASRSTAARHNLAVRLHQITERKKKSLSSAFEDSRLSGLSAKDINELIKVAAPSESDRETALVNLLNSDVQVGDPEIDSLTIRELKDYIGSQGNSLAGELAGEFVKIPDMRLQALELKNAQVIGHSEANEQELSFFAPQLTEALSSGKDDEINRAILNMFFEEFDPRRLTEIDKLLEQYKGIEDELFVELAWKYPEQATKLVAFSINAAYGEAPVYPVAKSGKRRESFVIMGSRT